MIKPEYVPIIQEVVANIRENYHISNVAIEDHIFEVLQQQSGCIIMRQPLEEEPDLDGLSVDKIIQGKWITVVYINTAKTNEKQVFCAAHELGHICGMERYLRDRFPDDVFTHGMIEDIMNRFAAELLIPWDDFCFRWAQHLEQSGKQVIVIDIIKYIILLMDHYYVPYKAIIYRMHEVGLINKTVVEILETYEKKSLTLLEQLIRKSGITRLCKPDKIYQLSEPVMNSQKCLQDPNVKKYLTVRELKNFGEKFGLSDTEMEDELLLQEMETRKIEVQIPISDRNEKE